MGFSAFIEVNGKPAVPICNENKVNVGNPLSTFLASYEDYFLRGRESPCFEWFLTIEKKMAIDPKILLVNIYFGENNYSNNEIEEIKSKINEMDENKKAYLETLQNIEKKWRLIDDIEDAINDLFRILDEETESNYWFDPVHTVTAFKSLRHILQSIEIDGKHEIRLNFI
jgi:hypothetical protein